MGVRHLFRDILSPAVALLGAMLFLWEEILWANVGRAMAALGRVPAVGRLETNIRGLPPYAAVILFAIPFLIVWPLKIGALWLVALGRPITGTTIFFVFEVGGAALAARVYALCRPALRTLPWFVAAEERLLRYSVRAHAMLARIPAWHGTRQTLRHIRLAIRRASRRHARRYRGMWRSGK